MLVNPCKTFKHTVIVSFWIIIIIIIKGIYIAQIRKGHKCAVGRDGSMVT